MHEYLEISPLEIELVWQEMSPFKLISGRMPLVQIVNNFKEKLKGSLGNAQLPYKIAKSRTYGIILSQVKNPFHHGLLMIKNQQIFVHR